MIEEPVAQPADISLRDYIDILRRRKAIVLQTFVVVVAVGVVLTLMAKPLYQSTARILVEGVTYAFAQYDATNPLSSLFVPPPGHAVETQIEVLQSEKVLEDAYRTAKLPPASVQLTVEQVGDTDVVEIRAVSENPEHAQKLAEALPQVYLKYVTGNRKSELHRSLEFAQARLREETAKLDQAEAAMHRFKSRSRVVSVEKQRDDRIAEASALDQKIREAELEIAGLRSQISATASALQSQPPYIESRSYATNPAIDQIRDKIATLRTQRAGVTILFKPGHTKVQEIDAQIADLESRLAALPPMVSTTTRVPNPAVASYQSRIADLKVTLRARMAGLDKARASRRELGLVQFSSLERQQARLQRQIERHANMVAMLTKSVEDLSIREKASHDPVATIAPAGPATQIAPKKLANLIYAICIGLALGFCLALLQEYLDDRINSPDEARRLLGAPVLGYIPFIEEEDQRVLARSPSGGSVLESYRVLRSNVQFAAVDTPMGSILVSSTVPGEGKSVTACNLAVAMALDGRRVILVDADLRRPSIHEKLGLDQQRGLTRVLIDRMSVDEALQDTAVPGLRVLCAGPLPPNPAELLNSQAMRQLHAALCERADVVIFDTPPFLAAADAQVLSACVDGVLYVVQFGESKKSAVRHAGDLIDQARANLFGIVFNKIDLTGKRDSYYYGYQSYFGYYGTPQIEAADSGSNGRSLNGSRSSSAGALVGAAAGDGKESEA